MYGNHKSSMSVDRSVLSVLKSLFDSVTRHPSVAPSPRSRPRVRTRDQQSEKCHWSVHGDIWRNCYDDRGVGSLYIGAGMEGAIASALKQDLLPYRAQIRYFFVIFGFIRTQISKQT